ncbi:hypothetical protein [Burkholderia gladioli]|uniref:hypothetical protein n=1 Tax=Burkholderia gladioli TaxID=28095 RepID=UPI002FE01B66
MTFDQTVAIATAVATAATAVIMFLQYRQTAINASPYFQAVAERGASGLVRVRLLVTPGDAKFVIRSIKCPGCRLVHAEATGDGHGREYQRPLGQPSRGALSFKETIAPSRINPSETLVWFFASTKSDRISLKIRSSRWLVRYSIQAEIRTSS